MAYAEAFLDPDSWRKTQLRVGIAISAEVQMETSRAQNDAILLTCWKDIARYMGKGVRTVQRWEQTLDLPVRRPRGNAYKSAVMARPEDLDVWLASRWSRRGQENPSNGSIKQQVNPDLGASIQTARQLRAANCELVREMSSALETLVRNCHEMQCSGTIKESLSANLSVPHPK
jgi:hypothetical protein